MTVTAENRSAYVREVSRKALLGDGRQTRLDYIKQGFREHPLADALGVLSVADLQKAIGGRTGLDGKALSKLLTYSGFPRTSRIPSRFEAAVKTLTKDEATDFLLFSTSLVALPPGKKVTVARSAARGLLPVAHTCVRRLDVCDDDASEAELRTRLLTAIRNNMGFGIA